MDSNGIAYMPGTTNSTDFPVVGNSVQTRARVPSSRAFVAVIDPSQYGGVSLTYSTYLGRHHRDQYRRGESQWVNNANIYVIGTTASTDFPVTTSAYAQVLYGSQDAFLFELNPNSTSLVYSTYLGGELDDDGHSIALGIERPGVFRGHHGLPAIPLGRGFLPVDDAGGDRHHRRRNGHDASPASPRWCIRRTLARITRVT